MTMVKIAVGSDLALRSATLIFVVAVALWAPIATGRQALDDAYDPALAQRMVYFAAAAYADASLIMSWNFTNPQLNNNISSTFRPLKNFTSTASTSAAYGFVGVDEAMGELIVAFRGTSGTLDILHDLITSLDATFHYDTPCYINKEITLNIHAGICWYYQSLQEVGLVDDFLDLQLKHPELKVIATGHSLGGALAQLFAIEISTLSLRATTVYTFGSPRLGDTTFAKTYDQLDVVSWRVVHWQDVIPHLAPCCSGFFGQNMCDSVTEACPFHTAGEAFYADVMEPGSSGTILAPQAVCAQGENATSCSDSVPFDLYNGVGYHLYYFGIRVGQFARVPSGSMAEFKVELEAFKKTYPDLRLLDKKRRQQREQRDVMMMRMKEEGRATMKLSD